MCHWRERCYNPKRSDLAMRTARDVDTGDALPEGGDGFDSGRRRGNSRRVERSACFGNECALVAVGEQAVVADAVEAARQDVEFERREITVRDGKGSKRIRATAIGPAFYCFW